MKNHTITIFSVTLTIILICCAITTETQAQSKTEHWTQEKCDHFREFLQQLHNDKKFNGTVLLAENGQIKFHESIGYSNYRKKTELDNSAAFRLASVSKQFTCMGIMLLKKQGKLDFDDKVVKHIPEFPYENISIRQLMHHTSGLPDYMFLMGTKWEPGTPIAKKTVAFNKDMIDQFVEHKPNLMFEPGEKFQYSNSGYVVLGHLIAVVSGVPTGEFLTESIFKPLEMRHSYVFATDGSFAPKHRVYGFAYNKSENGFVENDHHFLNGMVGDGGIYASALDMLKWDQALNTEKLVSMELMDLALTPGKLNDGKETGYGFGWSIAQRRDGHIRVSHGGGWVGFVTYIIRDISAKRTVIILTNHSSRSLKEILQKLKSYD